MEEREKNTRRKESEKKKTEGKSEPPAQSSGEAADPEKEGAGRVLFNNETHFFKTILSFPSELTTIAQLTSTVNFVQFDRRTIKQLQTEESFVN